MRVEAGAGVCGVRVCVCVLLDAHIRAYLSLSGRQTDSQRESHVFISGEFLDL